MIKYKTIGYLTLTGNKHYPILDTSLCRSKLENVIILSLSKFQMRESDLLVMRKLHCYDNLRLKDTHIVATRKRVSNECNIYRNVFFI